MFSDGDRKAHAKVNVHPYLVSKEKFSNHGHKRSGYHLGQVSALAARDNVRTGDRSLSQLTDKVIKKLCQYYGRAVSIYE